MKILHMLLIVLFSILLTSCEQLGIEVATVKGEWKSEAYKSQYLILKLSDNGMSHRTIHNDSIIVNRGGTWSIHNDTLSLFHQDFNANGTRRFKIEQISMNNLTLRNLSNEDVWIMTRQYSTPNSDYDSHFNEVFDLKKGFWWYVWNITLFAMSGLFLYFCGCALISLVTWIYGKIKSCLNQKTKK